MINKNTDIIKKMSVPILDYGLVIGIGNIDRIIKRLKIRLSSNTDTSNYNGLTLNTTYNGRHTVVILIDRESTNRWSVIAHECKHATNNIFEYYGVKLDPNNDEYECYFLDWIVEQVQNVIQPPKKKPNVKKEKETVEITK